MGGRLFTGNGSAPMFEHPAIGNSVYYFMPDHSPTRYLVHYDLDIFAWVRPGKSWVADARNLIKSFPRDRKVWHVKLNIPWFYKFVWEHDVGSMIYRSLRLAFSIPF